MLLWNHYQSSVGGIRPDSPLARGEKEPAVCSAVIKGCTSFERSSFSCGILSRLRSGMLCGLGAAGTHPLD